MEEVKISNVHTDLARKIANIFAKGREKPYISKEELAKVLHPVLSLHRVQILFNKSENLFKEVDTNQD